MKKTIGVIFKICIKLIQSRVDMLSTSLWAQRSTYCNVFYISFVPGLYPHRTPYGDSIIFLPPLVNHHEEIRGLLDKTFLVTVPWILYILSSIIIYEVRESIKPFHSNLCDAYPMTLVSFLCFICLILICLCWINHVSPKSFGACTELYVSWDSTSF